VSEGQFAPDPAPAELPGEESDHEDWYQSPIPAKQLNSENNGDNHRYVYGQSPEESESPGVSSPISEDDIDQKYRQADLSNPHRHFPTFLGIAPPQNFT
jgi:hypothetical protein